MKQRYRYRLYPTPHQQVELAQLFGCCRVVWNDALAYSIEQYKQHQKSVKNSDLQKLLITQAKRTAERSWLADVATVPLQQSIADLGVAFSNFFKSQQGKSKGKRAGFPRFKKRTRAQSARFTKPSIRWTGDKMRLPRIGALKVKWSRSLPSEPSSVTVIKDAAGRYFASFVIEVDPQPLPWTDSSIGIDLGIITFATLSTGEKIDAPKPLSRYLKKLARLQKALSRCQKGSQRRKRARQRVARVHARIKDIRTDFLHKLTTRLVHENQGISLEDLNVSGMVQNHKLARAISDLGWREFRTLLEAKAKQYGKAVSIIDRWEPTSQTCSTCGFKGGRKELDVREWQCLSCGTTHDRDINAAINIMVAGGQSETQNGRRRTGKTAAAAQSDDASSQPCEVQLALCF